MPTDPGARLPPWLKRRLPVDRGNERWLKEQVATSGLNTVCEEARCPNLHDCYQQRTATFLLMGDVCTRHCTFCAIAKGTPTPLDEQEPQKVARLVARMGLRYAVLTSVDRDDLPDGGAGHFVDTLRAIRAACPHTGVEVLTPDFQGHLEDVATVAAERPQVFNHNVETVPRLYKKVRPGSVYERSLSVLGHVADNFPDVPVKSGLMLGVGERMDEVLAVMADLRGAGVSLLCIGQYLSPANRHLKIERFVPPQEFTTLADAAKDMGFSRWHIAPFARSSYHAGELVSADGPLVSEAG